MFDKVRKSVLTDSAIEFTPTFLFGTADLTHNCRVGIDFFKVSVCVLKVQGAKVVENVPIDLGHEPGLGRARFGQRFHEAG